MTAARLRKSTNARCSISRGIEGRAVACQAAAPDAWRNLNSSPHKPSRSRYRSYRPSDDHYTSYSGQQRPCISPYLDAGGAPQRKRSPIGSRMPACAQNDCRMVQHCLILKADHRSTIASNRIAAI
ncbi:BA14K family protein [Mesorhizobium sp. M1348]|uniref:BA14K family protein n=1 Tax=unclassified Mesorhizobium TaxID=325217 RepID=UPI00333B22AF